MMPGFGFGSWRGPRAGGGGGAPPVEVGGVVIGTEGGAGTLYEGYSLAMGDDFNTLSVIGPATPSAKYATTRLYAGSSPRGPDAVLQKQYNTDPLHTGFEDSNRGVAVGYDNMRVSGSDLILQARAATAPEQAHFQGTGRTRVAAVVDSIPAHQFHPGVAGTGDIIVEARMKWTNKAVNPAGWHPTFWLLASDPATYGNAYNGVEIDVLEGNSQAAYFGSINWTTGTPDGLGQTVVHDVFDGLYHDVLIRINRTNQTLYIDGVQVQVIARDGNFTNEPLHWIFSSHVYDANFKGETYVDAEWDSTGAQMNIDWVRVWKRTAQPHYKPLVTIPPANIAFGGSTTITLPPMGDIWGDATVTEYLSAVGIEENEPGMTHTTKYTRFPAGVSYNSGTRVLTVAPTDAKSGRILFNLTATKEGATCEPVNFWVNIGPRRAVASVDTTVNVPASIDLYKIFDCGVLTSNASGQRAKTLVVTGLPSGLSYDDATGLLTGTPTAVAATVINVTATNSVGQVLTTTMTINVVGAAISLLDNFTATGSLTARTSDSGATWALHTSLGFYVPLKLSGTSVFCDQGGAIVQYASAAGGVANYYVEGDIIVRTVTDGSCGVLGRVSTTALTYYGLRYNTGVLTLFKSVNATLTTLGTHTVTFNAGETNVIRLVMSGNQISANLNGTQVIAPVTDNSVTAANRAGVRIGGGSAAATSTTGTHIDAIRAAGL